MNRMRVVGSKVGIPPLVCGGPRGPKCWKKKAIVSFPTRPDWGAADAAKKRAAFRSPTAPLGRETEGYPAQAQGPGGVGKGFRAPPFPGGLPGALRTGAKLHRRLVVTDDPPIEP